MNNPLSFEMQDPNNTSALEAANGGPYKGNEVPGFGKSKITSTDMSGDSGQPMHTLPSMAAMMPTKGDSGLGGVQAVEPITFGDPNNTSEAAGLPTGVKSF